MIKLHYDFYIAATPIGNYKDITIRTAEILQTVDFIVCEKEKEYKKLFGRLHIPIKEYVICDRKREQDALDIVVELLESGKKGALISDCGTPLFEDPGFHIVNRVRKEYSVTALPGANSLITALCLSPFKINTFYFAGFLPRDKKEREKSLISLLKRKETVAFFETPYRLINVLEILQKHSGKRRIYLPYNLTMEDEFLFFGKPRQIIQQMREKNIAKGEFLIVIEGGS